MNGFCEIHARDEKQHSIIVRFVGTDEIRLTHIESLRDLYREQRKLPRRAARKASTDHVAQSLAQWLEHLLSTIEDIGNAVKEFKYVRVL